MEKIDLTEYEERVNPYVGMYISMLAGKMNEIIDWINKEALTSEAITLKSYSSKKK